jgi:chloramphenicol 3-O-phosphotransferase
VVSGIAQPVPEWTEETGRQFRLARETAAAMARIYAAAGFAVAIDDVIFPEQVQAIFAGALRDFPLHRVLLRPRVEVALERNARRSNKAFDTAVLVETIGAVQGRLDAQDFARAGWLIVDNSLLTVDETVDEILRRSGLQDRAADGRE